MKLKISRKAVPYILVIVSVVIISLGVWHKDLLRQEIVAQPSPNQESQEPMRIEPIQKAYNGINILVDPRIELLASVQLISNYNQRYGLLSSINTSYKADMKEYFLPFQKHKVVEAFNKMSERGFSYDAPPHWMVHLSKSFEVEDNLKIPEQLIQRAGGQKQLNELTQLMQNYYHNTEFEMFWKEHETFYTDMIDQTISAIGTENRIDALEAYYGKQMASYNIILAPLFHAGGFGPSVESESGEIAIYSIQGPHGLEKGLPTYGSEDNFTYLMWHEFGHSFVNPLTTKYRTEALQYESLYQPIETQMKNLAYSNWETSLNEHIVRAVVARLTALRLGESSGEYILNKEREQGFIYIDAIYKKLLEYEKNREVYPTFETFYVELLSVFEEIE